MGKKNTSQKTHYVFYPPIQAEKPWGTDSESQAEFCLEFPKAWNQPQNPVRYMPQALRRDERKIPKY